MFEVRVEPFGHTYRCGQGETLLSATLGGGLYLRYGCRHGGCGTCKVALLDGDVDIAGSSYALPPAERDAGTVLVCRSYPVADCVLDVSAMNLDEAEFLAGDSTATYAMTVESVEAVTGEIRRVRLRHDEGVRMPFVAGQFVNVTVPGTSATRSYSIANPPGCCDRIERLLPGGLVSGRLETAVAGSRVDLTGPFGMLAVRLSHRGVVMVAGGSGLAPLLAMLEGLAAKDNRRPVVLFFGARTPADLYALEQIGDLVLRMPCLTFVPIVEHPTNTWAGLVGPVTEAIASYRSSYADHDAYLCGPPRMIEAASDLLVGRGVRPQNVYFDAFVATGDPIPV